MEYNNNYGIVMFVESINSNINNNGINIKLISKKEIENSRLAIPFSRKDTPVLQSAFSSLILTLLLTFNIYVKIFDKKLHYYDLCNLINNMDKLIKIIEIIIQTNL